MEEKEQEVLCGRVFSIDVAKIVPNPNQPRKFFTEEAIIKLADSIRQYGIMQPLNVRKIGADYELVSGERRLRAAKELGLEKVPCIVVNTTDQASAEMAIIENLMREGLTIFEQAEAIRALIDTYSLTQEEIAAKLSTSQSFIANKLRLLRLSQRERELIISNKLTERHARALLRISNAEVREKALKVIIDSSLNVSKAEELIEKLLSKGEKNQPSISKSFKSISSFCESLTKTINCASSSGLNIKTRKVENDDYTEIVVIIPKIDSKSPSTEAESDI